MSSHKRSLDPVKFIACWRPWIPCHRQYLMLQHARTSHRSKSTIRLVCRCWDETIPFTKPQFRYLNRYVNYTMLKVENATGHLVVWNRKSLLQEAEESWWHICIHQPLQVPKIQVSMWGVCRGKACCFRKSPPLKQPYNARGLVIHLDHWTNINHSHEGGRRPWNFGDTPILSGWRFACFGLGIQNSTFTFHSQPALFHNYWNITSTHQPMSWGYLKVGNTPKCPM